VEEVSFRNVADAVEYVLEGKDQGGREVGISIVLAACTASGHAATELSPGMRKQLDEYNEMEAILPVIELEFESAVHSCGRCKMLRASQLTPSTSVQSLTAAPIMSSRRHCVRDRINIGMMIALRASESCIVSGQTCTRGLPRERAHCTPQSLHNAHAAGNALLPKLPQSGQHARLQALPGGALLQRRVPEGGLAGASRHVQAVARQPYPDGSGRA
jgi:hypothetical protein